jgi:hypothetical protein
MNFSLFVLLNNTEKDQQNRNPADLRMKQVKLRD